MTLLSPTVVLTVVLAVMASPFHTRLTSGPARQASPTLSISPLRGAAGTVLQVSGSGFPSNTNIDLGAGPVGMGYPYLASTTANAAGQLSTQLAIPAHARAGQIWVVVAVVTSNPSLTATSNVFAVTGPAPGEGFIYTVQPGDSPARIALRLEIALEALLAVNPGLTSTSVILVGQQLVIPGQSPATVFISPLRGPPGTRLQVEAQGFPRLADVRILIGPTDGLLQVADLAYTTDAGGRLTAQVILPASAVPGQLWVVRVATVSAPPQAALSNTFSVLAPETGPTPTTYTVQPGDNLWRIARSFGTTVAALLQANPQIENSRLIFAGQRLTIPTGAGQPATVTLLPLRGAAGSPLQVNASGFPANTEVSIGVGPVNQPVVVTYAGQTTDANGRLATTVAVPPSALPGELWTVQIRAAGPPAVAAVSNVFAVTQAAAADQPVTSVAVYVVALGQGQVGCGDALRAVLRPVPATTQPWQAAIEALLALDDASVAAVGLYDALAQSDLRAESVEVDAQGTALVRLSGALRLGGGCDAPRIAAQLEQTALQFPAVRRVEVFVNDEPLDALLSARGLMRVSATGR